MNPNETTADEAMIAKISALLAKAERTEHAAEAEAFSAKAEELMMRWAIDDAMIDAHRGAAAKKDTVIQVKIPLTGTHWKSFLHLASAVGGGFKFKVLQQTSKLGLPKGTNGQIIWVGFESEIRKAEMLYGSLLIQCNHAQREWLVDWKAEYPSYITGDKMERFKATRSFIFGFADAVRRRLTEMRRTVVQEAEARTTGVALALIDRDRQLVEAYHEMYPYTRPSRGGRVQAGIGGYGAGHAAGQRAGLATESIGARGAIGR